MWKIFKILRIKNSNLKFYGMKHNSPIFLLAEIFIFCVPILPLNDFDNYASPNQNHYIAQFQSQEP